MIRLINLNIKFIFINIFEFLFLQLSKTGFWNFKFSYKFFYYFYTKYKLFFEKKDILYIASHIKPNSTILDIGANIGIYTHFFLKYSDHKSIILAFEADKKNYEILTKKFKNLKKIKCFNYIVSNTNGYGYLKKNLSNPTAHFIAESGEKIKSVKLDSIINDNKKKVSLIKIDVEGAEALVLIGAKNIIKKNKPAIYLEYSAKRIKKYHKFDLISFLKKNKYKFYIRKYGKFTKISTNRLIKESNNNEVIDFLCK